MSLLIDEWLHILTDRWLGVVSSLGNCLLKVNAIYLNNAFGY